MISIETDTIDYHRSDDALQERENYLETIFNSVQTGLLVIDPETHSIVDVNPAAAELIGLDRSLIVGSICHQFICPAEAGKCPITDLGQKIDNSERILLKADGSRIPILKTGIAIKINGRNYLLESFLDLSERKTLEGELQESEAKFKDLAERALVGIYLIQDGIFKYVNPEFAEIHGYSVEEMLGVLGPKDVLHPDDCPIAEENIRKRLSGESPSVRYETRIVTKSGDIRSVELCGSKTLYQCRTGVVGTALDITERKQSEEALREAKLAAEASRAQYEQVVSMISDVVWRHDIDAEGEYIGSYISPVADRMLGLPEGSIRNNFEKFFSYIHPDDLSEVQKSLSEDTRAFVKDFTREFRMLKTDGTTIWVRARGSVHSQPDGRITVFGTTSDITERKEAEEALRETKDYLETLIDYANAPIIVWDSSFKITRFNHAFERLTQKSAVDVLGKNLEILFPEDRKARSLEYIKRTSSGERLEVVEIPVLRSDGSVRIVLWNSANIYDRDGTTILTTIAQGQDITERKSSEDAIKESQRRLTDIIDFLPDATFAVDKAGFVIAWNRAMEEMTGIGRNEMLGQGDHAYTVPFYGKRRPQLLDLLDKDDNEIASNYQNVQRRGNSLYAEAFTPALRQGKGAYVWATAGPIFDVLGNRVGAIESIRDITERKYEQDELKNNLRFLETLIETIPSPIFFLDRQGRYLGCNDAFAQQIIGRPKELIVGKTVFELPEAIPPDLAEMYYEQDQKLFRESGTQVYEMQVQCSDGNKRDFFFTKATFKNHTGDVAGIVGVMLDITERKQMETAQRESREFLDKIINSISDPIFVVDRQHRHILVNDAMCEMSNRPREEFIGKTPYDFFPREQVDVFMQKDELVFETGKENVNEETITDSQGVVRTIITKKTLYTDASGNKSIVGIIMDITDRKKTEEALKVAHDQLLGIIDFLPDATFVIDKEGIVIAWNRAIETMTEIRAEDILGKGNYEYAIPFYGERRPILIDLLLKQVKEIEDKYARIERKDEALEGEAFMPNMNAGAIYLYGKAAVLYDSTGNLYGAIESIRDITERKNAEQVRERLVKELESKNAEMERFTYTVSHDLRSPLITVSGLVGFLKSDLEKGNATRATTFLERITNAIAKMDNLLKDTLELSRIGRVANPPDNVAFDDIVQDALSQVQERITKSGTRITVAQAMPDVFVDRMRIVEVMVNLIENGIKYMGDQAHPEIEIGHRTKDGQHTFFVKDNGMGIDPSQFDKVFELFYKVNDKSEGTGAGLAIVKRIVEVQGGRIWVESEDGKGSAFCFSLPVQPSKGV